MSGEEKVSAENRGLESRFGKGQFSGSRTGVQPHPRPGNFRSPDPRFPASLTTPGEIPRMPAPNPDSLPVLKLDEITFTIDRNGEDHDLIHQASLTVTPGHFMAIVGPSGCGKTTLLKIIAGLNEESGGKILWHGRDLATEGDLEPAEIGYVPQFSIAYDHITVEESVENAVRLRVRTKGRKQIDGIVEHVLRQTGLQKISESMVKVLSGGQKRRLGLALELVSNPTLLLCDEVTSGLDPKSEREIVHLMHALAQGGERIVINVTHSLSNLELYDSVLVLYEGRVVYHGPPKLLAHYFSAENAEDVYPRLGKREAANWAASWDKHRDAYYRNYLLTEGGPKTLVPTESLKPTSPPSARVHEAKPARPQDDDDYTEANDSYDETPDAEGGDSPSLSGVARAPGRLAQFLVLVERRGKIFFRDRTHLLLMLAMLLGFPVLVIIFGLDGVEPLKKLSDSLSGDLAREVSEQREVASQQLKTGTLISGLVMFQVILLTLMGSNNSAREIASERHIFEKEKFAGLHPSSYLASKLFFLALLVLVQSVWMGVFVNVCIPSHPGDLINRIVLLVLVNGAMSAICLGISSLMRSPEQSSLLSVYLVGFQLPLSGAILALPDAIEPFTRPFISAYWAWSGSLNTMVNTDYQQAIERVAGTTSAYATCVFVLAAHIAAGVVISYLGCRKHQWD